MEDCPHHAQNRQEKSIRCVEWLPVVCSFFSSLAEEFAEKSRCCIPAQEQSEADADSGGRTAFLVGGQMAAISVSSVGVRVLDDFDVLPLFDAPPLDGPTTKIGTLARGVPVRAIEKIADFLLLEGDDDDEGNSGPLGWADASCLTPTSFPAFYEFASDLPEGANLVIRASPQPGAAELGKISSYDPVVQATGLQGDYISMVHRDKDDPSSPQLQGWMLLMTDDRVLLTLKPPLLLIPAEGLPENAQFAIRSAPETHAPQLGHVSAMPGNIFESVEQCEGWVKVLMETEKAPAWITTSSKGLHLFQPAQRQTFVMDPKLVAQHGEGVKLAIRNAPSQDGSQLGELTCKGHIQCVGQRGPWLRVLYKGFKEAWMLGRTDAFQLLAPADSNGGSMAASPDAHYEAHMASEPPPPAPVNPANASAAVEFMKTAGPLKIREQADPFSVETDTTGAGDTVKVLETSGNWVRVAYRGREDGWILVANKRGTNLFPVEGDSAAAAAMFNSQEERYAAEAASGLEAPSAADDDDRPLSGAKPAASGVEGGDRPMDNGGKKGSWEPPSSEGLEKDKGLGGELASGVPEQAKFMEASGPIKVRDEADPFSLELAVTEKGDIVMVLETSGNWVRVAYRGREDGWILVANKRGTNLFPVEGDSAAAAAMFNSQEERYAAEAACAPSAADDDDRPLSGAKPAASGLEGDDRPMDIGGKGSWEPPSEFPPGHKESPSSEGLEKNKGLGGERAVESADSGVPKQVNFMEASGPIKVRDEADPFSLELAVTEKGDIVKVLETSGNWVRVAYRGREDGWILVANKRGTNLFPVEGDSAAAAAMFDSQEERYAAEAACAPSAADDDDRPLSGAKPAASGLEEEDRPLDTGGKKGSWEPPSEFPPGHNDSQSSEGLEKDDGLGGERAVESAASGVPEQAQFMEASGPIKVRDEADPFSLELAVTEKGDIVMVLETSGNWVRVAYRGREDGWILVANKRGTNLFPVKGDSAAADAMFNSQEERYAAEAACAPSAANDDDRPLSGAKPVDGDDRPMDIGGKGSWEPPSEFPPGYNNSQSSEGLEKDDGLSEERTVESAASGVPEQAKFMEASGPIKVRDEADPFSLELAVTEKGDIVKVLETSGNWVRVAYRGREDGWILVANKRGTNLFPVEGDSAAAAAMFNSQEERYAAEAASGLEAPSAANDDDRPLSGAKPAASGLEEEDRPLDTGGKKGSWEPPSEFPPGYNKSPSSKGLEKDEGLGGERTVESAASGVPEQADFMEASGPIKVRDEADPFSLELAVTEKGDIVKVLETSGNWVRVAYRGREDGWILVANKRGTNLFPVEGDSAAAAAMFNSQEERYASEAACTTSAADDDDRPLSGAKPASGLEEDRPIDTGGKKGSWEPPSEFPPGHNESPSSEGLEKDEGLGGERAMESAASDVPEQADFMEASGPIKVRDEADPFSLELAVTEKGDIVKVLETSGNWVRVAYRGREDGWILVANKRGTNLFPVEGDSAAAAAMFNSQEERYAAEAACAPSAADDDDRPLSGAKPAAPGLDAEDRPMDIGGGKKGSWEPPSEFPPGHEESPSSEGLEKDEGLGGERAVESAGSGVPEQAKFMRTLGPIKVRDEADPFSLELAVTEKGDIVMVLETSKQWVRVRYHGREDGWVLTANKRGPMLEHLENASSAAEDFDAQEAEFAVNADATAAQPAAADERPLTGANRKTAFAEAEEEGGPAHFDPMAMKTAVARDEADASSMGLSKESISQADSKSTKEGIELDAPGGDRPTAGGSEEERPTGLHNGHDDGTTVPPTKPWQRRPKGPTRPRSAASESKDAEGADVGGNASAPIQEKPWQKRRGAPLSRGGRAVSTSGSGGVGLGDGNENGADDVVVSVGDGSDLAIVEARSGSESFGGGSGAMVKSIRVQDQAEADGGDGVDGLEASLEDRDWKKRVAAYEGAARACRDGGDDTVSIVGPILPRMLQDKNVQAVEAALDVLLVYLPLRSPMGAEEGAALTSALAERALCCGRGQVEDKADEAAKVLLRCDLGEPAGRGAWLTLAARAGGLENEFFPPADNGGVGGNRGRSKAAIAASAPKAVAGCVRAMQAAIDGAAAAASGGKAVAGNASVVAGGGESREAVYAAASALLASQKVPIKMAGVSLAKSLFVAEGQKATDDLRVEDMEPRMKSQVERAFAEATASAVKSSSMREASPHADVEAESASDPAIDALAVTDVRAITSPMEEGEDDRGSHEEKPSSADRDLSVTPKKVVDRANEAAATAGSPVLPKSRTPCRSPCTPVRTPHTSIPDSTRHFFKPGSARRYTGYRALLAYGARTPFERESQFLAGQMLVLPEGQRSAWDDILDEVLSKGPPPTPFRPRRMVSDMSTPLGRLREAQGHRSEGYLSPPPLPLSPPPLQSPAAAPVPAGFQYGVMREARSVFDGDDKQDESGDLLREGTMRHLMARSPRSVGAAEQGSPVMVRAANASLRERIAKLGARNGRLDVDRGLALRGYGSWTSGMDDPTVAMNKEFIRADDDDLAAATAATRAVTDVVLAEVRERQRRRASIEGGMLANRRPDTTDLAAATRTAADVVFTEVRERRQASNESGTLADRPTLAVAHVAEPVVDDAAPGAVDNRGSSFRLAEPHRPHVDSWASSGHADEAVSHYEESASSSTISGESGLGQPRTGSAREVQPRPSELEANETPFETPAGSPENDYDSDSEYDSLKRILEKTRLGKYFRKFRDNAIMEEDLKYISEGELANIGIPLGARKRLLAEVLGFSSSTRERIHSPPSPASVASIAPRIPAPAATEGSIRRSGSVSLHSVRARLRQEELQRQRGQEQEQEQRFETGGGDEGSRGTDDTEDSTGSSLRERSSIRLTSAGSRPVGSSPFFGGRRRDRTTIGGSGAEERRAAMAAAELAIAETAEKISGIPARTSGIPRRAPGASRLRAPTARGGRMTGARGIPTSTRSLEGAGRSAPVASVEDPSPGSGRQSEIGARGRSSRALPAPRARTSFSRRSYQP